jgi:hypothetical protein
VASLIVYCIGMFSFGNFHDIKMTNNHPGIHLFLASILFNTSIRSFELYINTKNNPKITPELSESLRPQVDQSELYGSPVSFA